MLPPTAPRFVRDRPALDDLLTRAKQLACPRCHRVGTLVGHGHLTGYSERSNEREIRGRRLLCSARFRRVGCGRTSSVLLATVVANFTVRTPTVSALLDAVAGGLNRKAAWGRLQTSIGGGSGLSLRTAYRLWARLLAAQTRIRTALCRLMPPPASTDPRPIAQMVVHLRQALGRGECVLAAFQLALQQSVFG
jgi:hypothetical protein